MDKKIQIRSTAGALLFEHEAVDLKDAVEMAIRKEISLRFSNLRRSDLRNSNLEDSNLRNSDLSHSDLGGANLSGSDLRNSNLSFSDLNGSDLRGANLSGNDLSGANLRDAKLEGCKNLPSIYRTSLSLLKYQPEETRLRAFKYLNEFKSPYQRFEYEIGKTYVVEESDDDEMILCGEGINIATLDWCLRDTDCDLDRTYVEVEFYAKDLIIPYNSDGKFRIKKGGKIKVIRKLSRKELKQAIEPLHPTD
jgi:uncharacterized protein YjbI with pentapeptide repeats